ncbi:MAG: 50S ribosomal protein L11 methyltransferase [Planctomycetes bacterium]|nr:50S ribosomal protein L11 methyltransferase [Planctomycetota bacterium]
MSDAPTRLRLTGAAAARAAALDRLLVHADVAAVLETDDALEVAVRGAWPALTDLGELRCELLAPAHPGEEAPTGLERDAVVRIAPDLAVRPPWVAPLPGFRGIELVVPRGGAFGSGEHGSTQAALVALHRSWPADAAELTVADVGTGSGILAAYAKTRGAGRLLACDVDPAAVRAARELLGPAADVRCGGPEAFAAASADLLIANLDAAQLTGCLDGLLRLWSRRGPLVVSGLRVAEVERVVGGLGVARLRVERDGFVAQVYAPDPATGAAGR